MLAHVKPKFHHVLVVFRHEHAPLRHQRLPHRVGLFPIHQAFRLRDDQLLKLCGQQAELRVASQVVHEIPHPLVLLRSDVGRGGDLHVGVDQEKRKDLTMAGFGRVDKAERRDTVLVDVWER